MHMTRHCGTSGTTYLLPLRNKSMIIRPLSGRHFGTWLLAGVTSYRRWRE